MFLNKVTIPIFLFLFIYFISLVLLLIIINYYSFFINFSLTYIYGLSHHPNTSLIIVKTLYNA